jgi:hypothetical protein
VPLVLAGHTHRREREMFGSTRVLVEGSTGGAGLRRLEGDEPPPLQCTVLYFDRETRRLQAYDAITVSGLAELDARIERTIVPEPAEDGDDGGDGSEAG